MSVLSPDTEKRLSAQAEQQGVPVDVYVQFLLARYPRFQAGLDEAAGRDYSHEEIQEFLEEDKLPPDLAEAIEDDLKRRPA